MSATDSLTWLRDRLELPAARVTRRDRHWIVALDDGEELDLGRTSRVLSTEALTANVTAAGGVLPTGITPRHVLATLRALEAR